MIVVFLQRTLKEKLPFILINTLLLHIPFLALMGGQNDRWRNKYTHCVWWRTVFPVVLLCQFFGSGGKQLLVLHTYVLRVQYSWDVVLVCWFWWEIVFGVTYVLRVQNSCAILSVFQMWPEIVLKMSTRFYKKLYYDPIADVCIS